MWLIPISHPDNCRILSCSRPQPLPQPGLHPPRGTLEKWQSQQALPCSTPPRLLLPLQHGADLLSATGAEGSRTGIPPFPDLRGRSHWGPPLLLFPVRNALSQGLPGSHSCFTQASGEMLPLPGSFSDNPIQTYPLLSSHLSRTSIAAEQYIFTCLLSPRVKCKVCEGRDLASFPAPKIVPCE